MLTDYQQQDKRFIENPGKWPNWPYLPMKYNGKEAPANDISRGFLRDTQPISKQPLDKNHDSLRTVIMICVWEFSGSPERRKAAAEKLKDPRYKKVYKSIEEMLLDGWQVD